MASLLTSQVAFWATAIAVCVGSIIVFDLFREKHFPPNQIPKNQDSPPRVLKSCLSSGCRKWQKEQKKKKRVQFADDVKDSRGNGRQIYKKEDVKTAEIQKTSCGDELLGFHKMPANRVALYSGILKDRVQRMDYSF